MEQAIDAQDFRALAKESWDKIFAAAYPQLLSIFQKTEENVDAQSQESLREIENTRQKADLQASKLNSTLMSAQSLVDAQGKFNDKLGEVLKETGNMTSSPGAPIAKTIAGGIAGGAIGEKALELLNASKSPEKTDDSQEGSSGQSQQQAPSTDNQSRTTGQTPNQGGATPPVTASERESPIQKRANELLKGVNPRTSGQSGSQEKPPTTASRGDPTKTDARPAGQISPNLQPYTNMVHLDKVNPTLVLKLGQAADEYNKVTGKKVGVSSGWRSSEHQARLYANRGNNPYPVAKPGTSNHEKGLAIDIEPSTADYMDRTGILAKYGIGRPVMRSKGASRDDNVHIEMIGGQLEPQEKPGADKDGQPAGSPAPVIPSEPATPPPPPPPAASQEISENDTGKNLQGQSQKKEMAAAEQASKPPRSELTQVAGMQIQDQDNKKPAGITTDGASPRDRLSQIFSDVA